MNVILTHPKHGAKIALSDVEIAHDEKLGWTRYTPATAPVVEDKPKRRYTRKPVEQPNSNMLASDDLEGD
jgi:hypothetical protein